MKKMYITPSLRVAEMYLQDGIMVETSQQWAENSGSQGDGGDDQDGTDGLVKDDRNLWDEEW